MKVHNMKSSRTGKAVANQFIIRDNGKVWFQSYETVICFVDECNNVFIDNGESYDASRNEYYAEEFSRTTNKYLLTFLRGYTGFGFKSMKEVEKATKDGRIQLVNLNA